MNLIHDLALEHLGETLDVVPCVEGWSLPDQSLKAVEQSMVGSQVRARHEVTLQDVLVHVSATVTLEAVALAASLSHEVGTDAW